jgi:cbb3-type cytochrome oxidase maturation protein
MYYPYFITYMLAGFVISLLVFFWALKHGQFRDQERARYLPLQGERSVAPVRGSRISRIEIMALVLLACAGLMATGAVLLFALIRGG